MICRMLYHIQTQLIIQKISSLSLIYKIDIILICILHNNINYAYMGMYNDLYLISNNKSCLFKELKNILYLKYNN